MIVSIISAWVIAQDAGVTPQASTVITGLISSSPFAAVLLFLLLNERSDRKQVQKDAEAERTERERQAIAERAEHKREMSELRAEITQVLREVLPAFTQSTDVLKDVQEAMSHEVEVARTQKSPGIERRLDDLIEALRSQR